MPDKNPAEIQPETTAPAETPKSAAKTTRKRAKKAKRAMVKAKAGKKGKRYNPAAKDKILKAVAAYKAKHGKRGALAYAHKEFKITYNTLRTWLKGAKKTRKPFKAGKRIIRKLLKASRPVKTKINTRRLAKAIRRIEALAQKKTRLQGQIAGLKKEIIALLED